VISDQLLFEPLAEGVRDVKPILERLTLDQSSVDTVQFRRFGTVLSSHNSFRFLSNIEKPNETFMQVLLPRQRCDTLDDLQPLRVRAFRGGVPTMPA
jgi:hypothetical protein